MIYGLSCNCHPERGIRYVGKTTQGTAARLAEHLKRAKKPHYPVNHWIAKHGPENIVIQVLEHCEAQDLNDAEVKWIAELRTFRDWKQGGLNASLGGRNMPLTFDKVMEKILLARDEGRVKRQKLDWETVRYIREDYSNNPDMLYTDYATMLGVSVTTIWQVIRNGTWFDPDYTPPVEPNKSSRSRPNAKGRPGPGPNRKFTDAQVVEIRRQYNISEVTIAELAERWDCSKQTMNSILLNQNYHDPEYVNTRKGAMTERHRQNISRTGKGKKKPEGFGAKISAAMTGEGHSMAKLSEAQVIEMLAQFADGRPVKEMAEHYGISVAQARRIKTGERWGHLPR